MVEGLLALCPRRGLVPRRHQSNEQSVLCHHRAARRPAPHGPLGREECRGLVLPDDGRRRRDPLPVEAQDDIDAGAWLFDDEAFKLVPPEKAKGDKTKMVVALTSLKAGTTRVRFVGDILGRYQKYDVMVEAVGK